MNAPAYPWLRFYGGVPATLDYPRCTLYEAVVATARRAPEAIAWDFFGATSTYRRLIADIDRCADVLAALGLGRGDRFLISMPTSPQGVIAFYAANRLGAVPAMVSAAQPEETIGTLLRQLERPWLVTDTGTLQRLRAVLPVADEMITPSQR